VRSLSERQSPLFAHHIVRYEELKLDIAILEAFTPEERADPQDRRFGLVALLPGSIA
jgi:hypothetical protein